MEKESWTGEETANFIEEDSRSEEIRKLTNPEEIQKAQKELEEKYDGPLIQDTPAAKTEPDKSSDTSEKEANDKTEANQPEQKKESDKIENAAEEKSEEAKPGDTKDGDAPTKNNPPEPSNNFKLTDEFINSQPESNRSILTKYKDKGKDELAKALANAVSLKDPYLKGNDEAIEAITKKLIDLPENDLIDRLVESQREAGFSNISTDFDIKKEAEITLPDLPKDDPKVLEITNSQIIQRLRKKYPDLPDDLNSPEYREFERDIRDEKGALGEKELLADIDNARAEINKDLQGYLFAQTNLKNLYTSSPTEIFKYLDKYSLGQLKNINDNFRSHNNKTIESEVNAIKTELSKYGLKPEDIGVDLELKPDNNGSYYNETLYKLLFTGDKLTKDEIDSDLVDVMGGVTLLKQNKLAQKFSNAYKDKIFTSFVNHKTEAEKAELQKIKNENLNSLRGKTAGGSSFVDGDIRQITDPVKIKNIMAEIEARN